MSAMTTGSDEHTAVTERVTVSLVPQAVIELNRLRETTGRSKTDLVNRAISLLAAVEAKRERGFELHAYDPVSGRTYVMEFLST